VEPVDIGTPRGAPEVIAKLTVDRVDLELWFGLRFTPVENDLSPAVMALARLSTGTLVGFAKLEYDPQGGVDLVQFGEREPRDVLIELLYETSLTHDQVSWLLPPRAQQDPRMWARTLDEAYLYFLLHAGQEYTDDEVLDGIQISHVGDERVMRFAGIELWVPAKPGWAPPDKPVYSTPEDPPSTIIDAGRWVFMAHGCGQTAVKLLTEYGGEPLDASLCAEVEENLLRAAGSFDEALKFVPPGADAVPLTACWSAAGLQFYREGAVLFQREALAAQAVQYHNAVADFRRLHGPARG
jgi:hypothetical protein